MSDLLPSAATAAYAELATVTAAAELAARTVTPAAQVRAALTLGRQMAQLYRAVDERSSGGPGTPPPSPPPPDATAGLGSLDEVELFEQRLLAVHAALHHINEVAVDAGMVMPTGDSLIAQASILSGDVGRQAVSVLHKRLMQVLSAAVPAMGSAYELGTALTGLCEAVKQRAIEFEEAVNRGRIDRIRFLLNRLRSILPPHSAQAVTGALNNWEDWLMARNANGPIHWDAEGPQIVRALNSQGSQWFDLLTGQKLAVDLLSIDDYVSAGETLLRRYRNLAMRFVVQWMWYLIGAIVVMAAIVVLLFRYGHGDTSGLGTVATLVAGVGITAKTALSTIRDAATNVENSLWQAELDVAIVFAATSLPGGVAPVAMPVTRPYQRKRRIAAKNAKKARQQAITNRAIAHAAAPPARTATHGPA